MPLIQCPDCAAKVSDQAPACPRCGRPFQTAMVQPAQQGLTRCKKCSAHVQPIVTSVGGGSCSVGSRDTWRCPQCKTVMLKKGCFVATAVYGDEDLIEVRFLRSFRDQILARTRSGRIAIRAYYRLGPYAAKAVELISPLRWVFRKVLDLVVWAIERTTELKREQHR